MSKHTKTYTNAQLASIAGYMDEREAARILHYQRNSVTGRCQFSAIRDTYDAPFRDNTQEVKLMEQIAATKAQLSRLEGDGNDTQPENS